MLDAERTWLAPRHELMSTHLDLQPAGRSRRCSFHSFSVAAGSTTIPMIFSDRRRIEGMQGARKALGCGTQRAPFNVHDVVQVVVVPWPQVLQTRTH
jgi:hypothetical protein